MQNNLTTGTIVQLKSGGPLMTVVGWVNNGEVNCCYFSKEDAEKLLQIEVPPLCLKIVS